MLYRNSESFDDEKFMKEALSEAKKAAEKGEVPVGAVMVFEGMIVARTHNLRENGSSAINHAEILAIDAVCKLRGGWHLDGCTLYVTLEPCPMCAGAVINSRITRVVYGAKDPRAGAFGSLINLTSYPFNHRPVLLGGVLENECKEILRDFFLKKR
ncbi:MAG: nucleoside deaminase [Clostridia bacterium]|nr:nucleoside deaminase [Clostridia bacterium]